MNGKYLVSFAYATAPKVDMGIEKMRCGLLEPRAMTAQGVEYLLKILNPFMSEEWLHKLKLIRRAGDNFTIELNSIEDNGVKLKKIVMIEKK